MSFLYDSEQEIEDVVRGFETCTTPGDNFHHREHLVVAVYYLQTLSREQAVDRMRSALLRFLTHHGADTQKYSEEVTAFWIDAVATQLGGMRLETPLVEKCNQIISTFSSRARTPASRVEGEE